MRRTLIGCGLFVAACLLITQAPEAAEVAESAQAKITREKKLPAKLKLDIEKKMLRAIIEDELPMAVMDSAKQKVKIGVFPGQGVTLTSSFELKGEMTLAEALDKLCVDKNWGWYVHSAPPNDQKDGMIYLTTNGKEHGFKEGAGPGGKETPKKETGKKDVAKKDDPKKEDPKDAPPASDDDKAAATIYDKAKLANATGKKDVAKKLLTDLLAKYPEAAVAADAKKMLERIGK